MSEAAVTLATRCPACSTAFRVVQDQLKVANGWVRCGRCQHVFDASGVLFVPDGSMAGTSEGGDVGAAAVAESPRIAEAPGIAGSQVVAGDAPLPNAVDVDVDVPLPDVDAPVAPVAEPVATLPPAEPTSAAPAIDPWTIAASTSDAAVDALPAGSVVATDAAPATSPISTSAAPPAEAVAMPMPTPTAAVVDIGIGSVTASPPIPAALPADDADDGTPPDFVDARFNEDLLAGLPGLRDPVDDDGSFDPSAADAAVPAHLDAAGRPVAGTASLSSSLPLIDGSAAARPAEPEASPPAPVDGPAPTFLRQSRRGGARRRDQSWVRVALGASALLLVCALGWQSGVHWRDVLAARWPATAPWLAAACAPLGCAVHPLRRIDDLSVDSTTLAPTAPESPALRLSVVLVNRGDLPLAAPSIDLSLTDTSGELIARKVLHPADFHVDGSALKPSATVRWQAVLNVAERAPDHHVAGYTVELFYP